MRTVTKINDNWTFRREIGGGEPEKVTLPHTWNAVDGQDGGNDYFRGVCRYERALDLPAPKDGGRVYVEFRGAAMSAEVFLNGEKLAEHKGGYSTFRVDLTDHLNAPETVRAARGAAGSAAAETAEQVKTGEQEISRNMLSVLVSNQDDVTAYPQKADFTFYGGIYRSVYLVEVPAVHFDLDEHGSQGIRVTPAVDLGKRSASVAVEVRVSGTGHAVSACEEEPAATFVDITLSGDARRGEDAQKITKRVPVVEGAAGAEFTLEHVHLWDGLDDPYLYHAEARLVRESREIARGLGAEKGSAAGAGTAAVSAAEPWTDAAPAVPVLDILDQVSVDFGCRTMEIDAQQGFLLNGRRYPLRGVARHQDRKAVGNAITKEMMEEDLSIILDMGANFIRLAHYQHAQEFYELCDEKGVVVWAEIPFITCFAPEGRENTLSQMTELIVQNYNHPSVAVWALSNEITAASVVDEALLENHRALNELAHRLDPTRKTAMADVFMLETDSPILRIPDVNAYNLYFGWYLGELDQNDAFFDEWHQKYPDMPMGFSEYGADANPAFQAEKPERGDYSEGYQALYHEHILKMIDRMPWLWMTSVWNMFDFAADGRDEGGKHGENQKGLVSFDRKIFKDSYYLYKAYWDRKHAFVHLCGSRYVDRESDLTQVKVYSNQKRVELFVDGRSAGVKEDQGDHSFCWEIAITGEHSIEAAGYGLPAGAEICSAEAAGNAEVSEKRQEQKLPAAETAGSAAASSETAGGVNVIKTRDCIHIRKVDSVKLAYCMNGEAPVVNWFDQAEHDLDCFSIEDKFGVLMAHPETAKILGAVMERMRASRGDVAKSTSMNANLQKMMGGMSLMSMLKQGGADEEQMRSINRMLQQIRK